MIKRRSEGLVETEIHTLVPKTNISTNISKKILQNKQDAISTESSADIQKSSAAVLQEDGHASAKTNSLKTAALADITGKEASLTKNTPGIASVEPLKTNVSPADSHSEKAQIPESKLDEKVQIPESKLDESDEYTIPSDEEEKKNEQEESPATVSLPLVPNNREVHKKESSERHKKESSERHKKESSGRIAVKHAQDVLVLLKTTIDTIKTMDTYEEKRPWIEEAFVELTSVEWSYAREDVSEILYKWGRFFLDHGKYSEGLARFWDLYEKFPETRWRNQVFEELVALEQPEDMVFIPGGLFTLGATGNECELKSYFLDIYPVTNAQYLEFIKQTGYPSPAYWAGDMYPLSKANHPVVFVSFEDAIAYACWRGKRLPTEMEWENAAKGPESFAWPWGNSYESKRCNCKEAGISDTSPVGQYELGRSFYKCCDMAGNVWEWTDTWYDPNTLYRILRGGSWFTFEDYTTTTYRNFDFPDSRKSIYGFRCCKSFTKPKK